MAKQALTPTGVQAKQSELNQLTDTQLAAEANSIRSDFDSWMDNNFTLSSSQKTYLSNLEVNFKQSLVGNIAFAVGFRRSVTLVINGTPSLSKFMRQSPDMVIEQTPSGVVSVPSGGLTITFTYT